MKTETAHGESWTNAFTLVENACRELRGTVNAKVAKVPKKIRPRPNEEWGDFMSFIDDQIVVARENIERARQKLAVLEELRREYSAKPDQFGPSDGTSLPPRQLLATQAIAQYLKHQTEPVRTTTLLRFLEEQGIKFGGRHPRNTLSVLLSRSKHFIAHGRRGWTIAEEEK